ncbi:hypothetical protein IVB34_12780 [Bradyrhizobium sp. 2]|uniref:hypothetical protein n=1 Tax=Bradyrhizobium sp. 2 TaxID=190045 RepID=UPI001FFAC14C|nr:hypothetical protein [Bradyrhizobium sp. 2]MCK1459230.1 hypothetical protein [Bradyrhizobium sp. 2]
MAKQAGVGVAKGTIGLAGIVGDIQQIAKKVGSYLPDIKPDPESEKYARKYGRMGDVMSVGAPPEFPTSHDIQGQVEKVTGEFRKPQTQVEADAETVGEFLPAALAGPGGFVRKVITQDVIPAAATIAAGRLTDQNPYVKALAGFLAGGVGAAMSGPSSAEKLIRAKIPASVTEQDINRAGQLIEHAQTRGVALTWPEALSRVTGQPVLTDTQRILESHAQTRPHMQEFFADRPAQIEQAARREFDNIGTVSPQPSNIGPQAASAAEDTITAVRAAINRATRPSYDAAGQTLVPQAVHAQAMADPLFARTLHEVRNNPELSAYLHAHSDRSVAVYDAVKQQLEQRSRNLAQPTNPDASQVGSSITGSLATEVRGAALDASRNAAHGPTHYERALGEQTRLREQYLNPLLHGPLGKLADAPDTKRAINALFQSSPLPGSQQEVATAVRAIVARRPAVAEQLVRAHAEMVFNEAARELQGGANQFAGAKFAKDIAGNSQQRENLRAAIEALPNGAARWQGFEHLLDIMAATGTRQPKGSLTAFNQLEVQSMSTGGLQELASKGISPGKWMSFANDTFKAWTLGRNLDQIARIITDPRSGDALRQIVRIPPGSDRALVMAGRLIALGSATTTEQRTKAANQ